MAITVDKGIPITFGGKLGTYPWRDCAIGDSFFVPGERRAFNAGHGAKVVPGSKWATRMTTVDGVKGLRVWRMK